MNANFEIFITHWQEIAFIWAQISLGFGALILVFYMLRLTSISSKSKKHSFISQKEIRFLWYAGLCVTISLTFWINGIFVGYQTTSKIMLVFKIFGSLGAGIIIGSTINSFVHVYYPFIMEKRLNKIRFKTRVNPNTGHSMRLLTEDEEDAHLTPEMIEHENIFAYEYDVWLDDETGYKIIETYAGNLHLQVCNECNFRTAKKVSQEIVKEPTTTESGEVINHYECTFCGHSQKMNAAIPPISS